MSELTMLLISTWNYVLALDMTRSRSAILRRNLVVLVTGNIYMGAINGMDASDLMLDNNVVSGSAGVSMRVPGVTCDVTSGPLHNEVHSSAVGVGIFPGDALHGDCHKISNYMIWKCSDIGIYYNNRLSVIISDNTVAENRLGLYNQVIEPSSEAHLYAHKTCTIRDSIVIGATASYNCTTDVVKNTLSNARPWNTHGHVGLGFTSFMGGSNGAPYSSYIGITTYPSIMGVTQVRGKYCITAKITHRKNNLLYSNMKCFKYNHTVLCSVY